MIVQVFIQNEAGSNKKHYHNERTLQYKRTSVVSRRYPFPYGFVVGTVAADCCAVDCFVISSRKLRTGDVVDCEVVGLMEQLEDGLVDHNIIARPVGETRVVTSEVEAALKDFVLHVFDHQPGKRLTIGDFLGAPAAESHLLKHRQSQ